MKKLLFFTSDYKIGISGLLSDQVISLKEAGANVIAVGGEREQETGLINLLQKNKIKLYQIPGLDDHANFNKLVNQIIHVITSEKIEVIHVQNNWQLAIAFLAKLKLHSKIKFSIIYTLHGFRHNHPIKSKFAQLIIGSGLLIGASRVICMTKYLRKKFILLSSKIEIIPLGVKEDFFLENFIPPSINGLHLIFPAQFRAGKNQDLIIQAFASFVKSNNDRVSTLCLPGNGPELKKMEKLAKSLQIEDQVIFPGLLTRDKVKELYLASNIAIVASNSETFGQSIVEPFVMGRCVVTTRVGIAPEIIKEGKNGFFFDNQSQLTSMLQKLYDNKEQLVEIGANNFSSREMFRWSEVTQTYIKRLLR